MRASIRGSIRSEMATDPEPSALPATAASMRRRSGLFSAQKVASASSLSKIGTSSHLAIARIVFVWPPATAYRSLKTDYQSLITGHWPRSLCQTLIHFPLIEEPFFGLERAGVKDAGLFSVRPIHAEDSIATRRHAQVEVTGLHRKPGRIRQEPDREGVFKRFFDFLQRQRAL